MIMNKIPYRSDMISYFFGEGKRFSDEPRNPLPHRTVHALNIISFSAALADSAMPFRRKNFFVCRPEIGITYRTLTIDTRQRFPQFRCSSAITVSYICTDNFLCINIFCKPNPVFIFFFANKRPHFVTFYRKFSFFFFRHLDCSRNTLIFIIYIINGSVIFKIDLQIIRKLSI